MELEFIQNLMAIDMLESTPKDSQTDMAKSSFLMEAVLKEAS